MRNLILNVFVGLITCIVGLTSANLLFVPMPSPARQPENAVLQPDGGSNSVQAAPADEECPWRIEGRYSNYDYAFSIAVPRGMIGFGGCATNHGFGIDLSNPTSSQWFWQSASPRAYLYIDASYNSANLESLDEAVRTEMRFLEEDKVTNIVLVSKTRTHLGGLPAVHFTIHYNISGEAMVKDMVLAFRKEQSEEIVYTISLTTALGRYQKDKEVMRRMQKTWGLQPLP